MLMKDPRQKTPYNMMEEYFMTPSAEMERKYNFFYQPYNYAAQVKKTQQFEDEQDTGLKIEDEEFLRDCVSVFGNVSEDDPWMKSRQ